jgi:hypothetical protein
MTLDCPLGEGAVPGEHDDELGRRENIEVHSSEGTRGHTMSIVVTGER